MPVPLYPVADFEDVFDSLERMVSKLSTASRATKKLPDGPEKTEIDAAIDSALESSGQLLSSVRQAREKLSRYFG